MKIFIVALLLAIGYAQTVYSKIEDLSSSNAGSLCMELSWSVDCATAATTATGLGMTAGACDLSTYTKHCSKLDQTQDMSMLNCGTQTTKMYYTQCTACDAVSGTCANSSGDNTPTDNTPTDGDTGSTCPATCKTAYELPANKDTLCQGEMTPTGCSEMDVPLCTSVFKAVCGAGDCPADCAAALKDSKNYDAVCGDGDKTLPSPCVEADGLNCLGEVAVACMGDGKNEPGMCTNEQNLVILGALMTATTPECKIVQEAMESDKDTTDKQGCDCFASGADFSALKTFNCKMDEDAKDNVSVLVNGGGVCSSSSALSLFFAVAALFFSLA